MTSEEFSAAFRGSPMKRAKLRGLKRNAAFVLRIADIAEDVPVLAPALSNPEPFVRRHAAWSPEQLVAPTATPALGAYLETQGDDNVSTSSV